LFVSAFKRHWIIYRQLVKNSGALDQLQHFPLAWPKKRENVLSEILYTVCLQQQSFYKSIVV